MTPTRPNQQNDAEEQQEKHHKQTFERRIGSPTGYAESQIIMRQIDSILDNMFSQKQELAARVEKKDEEIVTLKQALEFSNRICADLKIHILENKIEEANLQLMKKKVEEQEDLLKEVINKNEDLQGDLLALQKKIEDLQSAKTRKPRIFGGMGRVSIAPDPRQREMKII
ncbi:hypothetical protein TRFO_24475 [Tritrichomonas foetus]|uniref:Uncharacterized protein n=1 Tax=Tritrichomonas foetus TaxID=1144522 RepID=A0A1J4K7C6_9EUKA|nr:hypothetical protein TRFO_24475 [Tritrichomonas foetus]|eukprot:OHT07385.1 hypothetical protein TRFO_24475 [Tritrichomonas foetus]